MEQIKELLEKEAEKKDDRSYLRLIKRFEYFRDNIKLFSNFYVSSQVDPDWMDEMRSKESFYEFYYDKEHAHIYFTVKDKEGVDQLYRYSTINSGGHSILRFNQRMFDYINPMKGFTIDPHTFVVGRYRLPVSNLIMMGYDVFKCLFKHPLPPAWTGFVLTPEPNTVGIYQYEAVTGDHEMSELAMQGCWRQLLKLYAQYF